MAEKKDVHLALSNNHTLSKQVLSNMLMFGLWYLTPLSTIFQPCRGGHFH